MERQEQQLALDGESSRVEWKLNHNDTAALLHTVCALANDLEQSGLPGFLVYGVSDAGALVGMGEELSQDEVLRSISNRLNSTKLLPHPSFTLETAIHEGRWLVFVRVEPYPVPPVVRVDGVAWVRVGTETRRATEADVQRLQERRPRHVQPFDIRPLFPATVDDLNVGLLDEMYRGEHDADEDPESFPSLERWLAQKELLRSEGERWVANPAAILLYGVSPQSFLPGAIVELVRYDGEDVDSAVVLRKTASGTVPDQLETLWGQLSALVVEIPAAEDGIRTPYKPEYPIDALKELTRNLVQHRLYEGTNAPGRISWFRTSVVFNNPGAPFGQAAEGAFGEHSDYRNPTLTRGLVELGYVERLGRGIRRVNRLLERNANPALELETDGYTTVTLRRAS